MTKEIPRKNLHSTSKEQRVQTGAESDRDMIPSKKTKHKLPNVSEIVFTTVLQLDRVENLSVH